MSQNFIYNLQPSNYPMDSADKLRWLNSPEYWQRNFNGYDYVGNNIRGNYPGVVNQPRAIQGYGQTYSAPKPYTTGIGQAPLQGYASATGEVAANPEIAAEIDNLTKNTRSLAEELEKSNIKAGDYIRSKRPFNWTRVSTYPGWAKTFPIVGDAYDIGRGLYRAGHGQFWGGLGQAGLGTAGLATLGIGSIGKSLIKGAIKSQLKGVGKDASIGLSKSLLRNRADRNLLKGYKGAIKAEKLSDFIHNPWLRFGNWVFNNGGGSVDSSQSQTPEDVFRWDKNSYSTKYDNPDYNEVEDFYNEYFGDAPTLDYSEYGLDKSTYPSLLGDLDYSNNINDYGLPNKPNQLMKEDLIDIMKQFGYTDDAIQDALNGNDNGADDIRDAINKYNELARDDQKIKLLDRPIEEDLPEIMVPDESNLLTGAVEQEDVPEEDINAIEYLNALNDIDNIVSTENEEYKPYIEGLANYLKDYDDKYKFYHDMKRYYAAMSGLSGNSGYNYVPNGLDPRSSDLAKLELYSKLADKKIELDNRARQLKGNVDLAKSLGYPLSSAFADKNLLNAYTNAKLADSRIKATQAIAELNRENQLKIAEMNNKRALDVARLNNISAMDRVKLQQNEANYRKSLDIKEKELDRALRQAKIIGDYNEARKLEVMKQAMSNKRTALTALMNYITYGQDANMSVYDIASILGGDITALMNGIKKNKSNTTEGQLSKDFK